MAEGMLHPYRWRFPLMALALLALLAGLWAGLQRLGWGLPRLQPTLPLEHGPLMVVGFLGTLIGLERAVALQRLGHLWAYAAPLLSGLGALVLIVGLPAEPGQLLILLGNVGLVAIFALLLRHQTTLFMVTMTLGALCLLVGSALWLAGWPFYHLVLWWGGFLVLTIVGERLELSRVRRLTQAARGSFMLASGLLLAGLVLTLADLNTGVRLSGVGLLALALWLLRYDVALRTVRQAGLTRFIALCLLPGYVWMGLSGLLMLYFGAITAGPAYDAMLHTLFLGFVFSMIFGHAPIIFPAVLRLPVPFRPTFYSHLLLLHLGLLLRIGGDLAGWPMGWRWGGLFNVVALLLFLLNTGLAVRGAKTASLHREMNFPAT